MHMYALVLCIWCCCIVWALAQERLTAHGYVCESACAQTVAHTHTQSDGHAGIREERFTHSSVINVIGSLTACIIASIVLFVRARARGHPLSTLKSAFPSALPPFCVVALTNTLGSPLGYTSLRYIPYPLFVLATAAKLVPIMLVGQAVHGRRYSKSDVATAALMTVGVAMYSVDTLAQTDGSLQDPVATTGAKAGATGAAAAGVTTWGLAAVLPDPTSLSPGSRVSVGLILVALNLLLDGFTTNGQDALVATQAPEPFMMMAVLNFLTAAFISGGLCVDWLLHGPAASLPQALQFIGRHPELLWHLALFGLCTGLAQLFIYVCISTYGSFVTTAVTISRKFFSILLSVAVFGHVLSWQQWIAILTVFGGLAMQCVSSTPGTHNPSQRRRSGSAISAHKRRPDIKVPGTTADKPSLDTIPGTRNVMRQLPLDAGDSCPSSESAHSTPRRRSRGSGQLPSVMEPALSVGTASPGWPVSSATLSALHPSPDLSLSPRSFAAPTRAEHVRARRRRSRTEHGHGRHDFRLHSGRMASAQHENHTAAALVAEKMM